MWKRLETWQANFDAKMTKERYFALCQQMGEPIDPEKIPPDIEDFPVDVQKAILIFNKLTDRVLADIGYLGKDYTQVPLFMKAYGVELEKLFLETITRLDAKVIEKSAQMMKAEREKIRSRAK